MGASATHPDDAFISFADWEIPVTFFVGRNGTGKTKAATALARQTGGRLLATDRLLGLMSVQNYGFAAFPAPEQHRGIPLGGPERDQTRQFAIQHGSGSEELYALREQPAVWLRVAAFIRRALGRAVELRETAGFLDPFIRIDDAEYSLLRDEGHGLRELVVLLAATYREDWSLLVVDEPELHLHPSLARLWLSELEAVCGASSRRGVVVTHEPSLLRPKAARDLDSIWFFLPGEAPRNLGSTVLPIQRGRIDPSLQQNPEVVSQLAFSPRPVLVEGKHDIAALTVALARTGVAETIAQTDFVDCGGTSGVALWFEIARKVGLDVRAVADLDAMFDSGVQRTVDDAPGTSERIRDDLKTEPPTVSAALRPLQARMHGDNVEGNPRAKAEWMTDLSGGGDAARRDTLLEIFQAAGIWLHPQGRLEQVLGIESKGIEEARAAAANPGPIDDVVEWCAYRLDPAGEVQLLLDVAIERIAHGIMEALRADPDAEFDAPVGSAADSDSKLVRVESTAPGRHRITVKTPEEFAGWWLEFTRETPASDLELNKPDAASS